MSNASIDQLMRGAITDIAVGPDRGRDISEEDANALMLAILNREVNEVQAGVFLIALRMKHESHDELLGAMQAIQSVVTRQVLTVDEVLVLADPFDGYQRYFPVTALLPALLSCIGINAVMHGVHSVGPKFGLTARQVYQLLGIDNVFDERTVDELVSARGWSFMDQRHYAPKLYQLGDLRDTIVKRTLLTTLERIVMPCSARVSTGLALGYVHKAYPDIYSAMAQQAGFDRVTLVKGVEGGLMPAINKPLRRWTASNQSVLEKLETEFPLEQWLSRKGISHAKPALPFIDTKNIKDFCTRLLKGDENTQELKQARCNLVFSAAVIAAAHGRDEEVIEIARSLDSAITNGELFGRFFESI